MSRFHVTLATVVATIAGLILLGGLATGATAKPKKLKVAPKVTAKAPYTARGSVGDAYVQDAKPGQRLLLVNAKNRIVRSAKADRFGSKVFYDVAPGKVFTVRTPKSGGSLGTKKFRVLKPGRNPKQSWYEAKPDLKAGLNYVTMRDGTELAVTVRLPYGKTSLSQGPFPTYIEYSGYQTAAPHDALLGLVAGLPGSSLPGPLGDLLDTVTGSLPGSPVPDPDLTPASSTAVGSLIGPLLDFATVSVQMRGSGCSGGAFDLFGWPTTYDGYDIIETVATQDWVKGGKVSMGGISFSGITQLFTAGTRPPHLSAVSPLSTTDDVYYGTGFPGGIFNNGFAYSWITERADDAKPAPEGGQPWARKMATTGDPQVSEPLRSEQRQHCIDNQKMRLQTRDYNKLIEQNPYRTPNLFTKRGPGAWVKNINVPIFWVGAFQDEQTGGHWVESVRNLARSNRDVWVTMENGVHVDSLGPSTISRWAEFMNLFTGEGRIPRINPVVIAAGPVLYQLIAESPALPIEQSRYATMLDTPQNVAAAKADFRKDPRIRILMDNGAAIPSQPGAIGAAWETQFTDWPAPGLKPTRFFLGKGGSLTPAKAARGSVAKYLSGSLGPTGPDTLGENAASDSWKPQPAYNWQPLAPGKGLGFITPALDRDVFIAGPSSVDLYLKSNRRNTDIQVTLTEVRPDGKETYVQNGWLRASHRNLNRKASTAYNPVQTWLQKDGKPLKKGKFNYQRIQIFPVAHVFRAGSKIRLNIQAPGGDRTIWNFATIEKGKTVNTIGLGGVIPSKLVLPVIAGQDAQGTPLPPPTALRGQPSRDYKPASNGG